MQLSWCRSALYVMVLGWQAMAGAAEADPLTWRWTPTWRTLEAAVGQYAQAQRWRTPAQREAVADMNKRATDLAALGTYRVFTGDEAGAMRAMDASAVMRGETAASEAADLTALDGAEPVEALAAIVEEARSHQIVMLNEAHHVQMNRAFGMLLARELKKIGFEVLAFEAVYQAPAPGAPILGKAGFYARDPQLANFLREAGANGWRIISYDNEIEQSDNGKVPFQLWRETTAAQQILKKSIKNGRQQKVFIYAGYSHIAEQPDRKGQTWLARLIKQSSGIDPLTIDQSGFFAHPEPEDEQPLYAQIPGIGTSGLPFVLKRGAHSYAVLGDYAGRVDMQVFFPRALSAPGVGGRSGWRSTLLGLTPRAIPAALLPANGQRVVSAFKKNETVAATPVDSVLVEAGKTPPSFMLPPGDFYFRVKQ
ncbi:hypothetical protein GTP58_21070 [Duganella sp. CY15W]|uniref:hypothetical protein n=1 Tax=Duganella sp. CY15W TaxID=2692172 RepID=UPI00136B2457|nr:hypothetical protein [Duganella sp. CY15W]MYM30831.1 hypothetical protein [Duganella sp. CY15W]